MQEIAKMKDHVIICGAGRTGRQVAQEIESLTHDHILLAAGLLHANGLITCLSADADNLT